MKISAEQLAKIIEEETVNVLKEVWMPGNTIDSIAGTYANLPSAGKDNRRIVSKSNLEKILQELKEKYEEILKTLTITDETILAITDKTIIENFINSIKFILQNFLKIKEEPKNEPQAEETSPVQEQQDKEALIFLEDKIQAYTIILEKKKLLATTFMQMNSKRLSLSFRQYLRKANRLKRTQLTNNIKQSVVSMIEDLTKSLELLKNELKDKIQKQPGQTEPEQTEPQQESANFKKLKNEVKSGNFDRQQVKNYIETNPVFFNDLADEEKEKVKKFISGIGSL